jgi:hypothetical protein
MTQINGPEIGQVTYKPVIVIEDSRKNEEGVSLRIAGSNGNTEFLIDEVVTIYTIIQEFLIAKGLNPNLEAAANRILDKGFISESSSEAFADTH